VRHEGTGKRRIREAASGRIPVPAIPRDPRGGHPAAPVRPILPTPSCFRPSCRCAYLTKTVVFPAPLQPCCLVPFAPFRGNSSQVPLLQQLTTKTASFPIQPNRAQSCLIVPNRVIPAAPPISKSAMELPNHDQNGQDSKSPLMRPNARQFPIAIEPRFLQIESSCQVLPNRHLQ
jgi:hypothetical protein